MPVIEEASLVGSVGFPEFTSKLVNDTFKTLLSNQARQTQAFLELTDEVNKTLTQYRNDTENEIGIDEIFTFIAGFVPTVDLEVLSNDEIDGMSFTNAGATVDQFDALNAALAINQEEIDDLSLNTSTDTPIFITSVVLDVASVNSVVINAVINRVSVNKFRFLRDLTRQGLVRLVVENGMIETSLNFTTTSNSTLRDSSRNFSRSSRDFGISGSGSFFGRALRVSAGANYNRVNVNTQTSTVRGENSESITISGRVKINFASDFRELTTV